MIRSIRLIAALLLLCVTTSSCGHESSERPFREAHPIIDPKINDQLRSLGYVASTEIVEEDVGKSGVTQHIPELAYPAYNLFNTRTSNRACLVSMDGEVVHEWSAEKLEGPWHHAEMASSGDLLVLVLGRCLARLSWDSEVLWKRTMNAHHDFALAGDETTYVLDRDLFEVLFWMASLPIVNDSITLLSAEGKILRKTYVYDLLGDRLTRGALWGALWARLRPENNDTMMRYDVFHTNTLELVDRDLGGLKTTGGFLICARELDLVAIISASGESVGEAIR